MHATEAVGREIHWVENKPEKNNKRSLNEIQQAAAEKREKPAKPRPIKKAKSINKEELAKIRNHCLEIALKTNFYTWIIIGKKELSQKVGVGLSYLEANGDYVKDMMFKFDYLDPKSLEHLAHFAKYFPNISTLRISSNFVEDAFLKLSEEQKEKLFKEKDCAILLDCVHYFRHLEFIHFTNLHLEVDEVATIFEGKITVLVRGEVFYTKE